MLTNMCQKNLDVVNIKLGNIFDAAILIYKQTILPLIDYAGFMFIACNHHAKEDLQIMQNDILRICCQYKLSDRISIGRLH